MLPSDNRAVHQAPKASIADLGFDATILSSARARPMGRVRCRDQFCKARRFTPINRVNCVQLSCAASRPEATSNCTIPVARIGRCQQVGLQSPQLVVGRMRFAERGEQSQIDEEH